MKTKVFCVISDCKCYSLTLGEVQALEDKVKSMSETINIIKDELNCESANEGARKPNSTYAEKLKLGSNPCCKCAQREFQLQAALDELSSVKLINNILHEEIKALTQVPSVVPRDNNPWTITKPSSLTSTGPPKTAHTSLGSTNASQYTAQSTNRFAVLSRHNEPQQPKGSIFSPHFAHPSRLTPKSNNGHVKGRQWNKSFATEKFYYQPRTYRSTPTYQSQRRMKMAQDPFQPYLTVSRV